jgi:arabinose-5-phosphate isomerase
VDAVSSEKLLNVARRVLELEVEAVGVVRERLGEPFLNALKILGGCSGKLVVTGLGKSGVAAMKIAATFSSSGAPALFLHSGEALHGDLGVVTPGDAAIAVSYSGETRELNELIPRLRMLGVPVVALTGNITSTLAGLADCVLDVSVPIYPWPFGILPTASVAATVAMGDALAVALLVSRGVSAEDFALLHPGGLIGRKLLVRVEDLMHTGAGLPAVTPDTGMREVLMVMTAKLLGVACVVNEKGKLLGIITDGDLRRLLERFPNPLDLHAEEAMTPNPKSISPTRLAARALHIMENHAITSLPVVDDGGVVVGLIHMHDIIKMETQR